MLEYWSVRGADNSAQNKLTGTTTGTRSDIDAEVKVIFIVYAAAKLFSVRKMLSPEA